MTKKSDHGDPPPDRPERAPAEIDDGLAAAAPDKMAPASTWAHDPGLTSSIAGTLEAIEPKFEMLKTVAGESADLTPYLDEGWEPIAILPHGFNENIYYFKRPRK